MLQQRLPSASQHNFANVPNADIPRSRFDRSYEYKTTFDIGYLIPFLVDEALPGDTFSVDATLFARILSPLSRPVMHNLYIDTQFFAIPIRLLWNNWQKFNGEQTDPGDSTDYLVPTMTSPAVTGYTSQSLSDYLGIPIGVPNLQHVSYFHRAYNLTWNEWYRDQNLQDSVVVDKDDGPDNPADYVLLRRGKRHDYFTSGLPFPQKGPAVQLPLSGNAPVTGIGTLAVSPSYTSLGNFRETGATSPATATVARSDVTVFGIKEDPNNTGYPGVFADLTDVAAATINQLRESFQIQKLYERDARGGTRYTEIIRAHFGVTSPDARLQRPEYLGGGSTPINIMPIAQNSSTNETTPQGNLAAVGTATVRNNGFTKSFTEHCVILGLCSVRADLVYQQGLPRMFSRQIRWDYYWPALSHIGEQPILNKEIYAQGTAADDDVFAYQERYAEYRYKPSMITGKLRSQDPQSLDIWHLAQDFASLPLLNADFIQENPPMDRVVATPDEPHFIMDSYIKMTCARPMPMYGVPGLIDHF